jgi:hypothetical protein
LSSTNQPSEQREGAADREDWEMKMSLWMKTSTNVRKALQSRQILKKNMDVSFSMLTMYYVLDCLVAAVKSTVEVTTALRVQTSVLIPLASQAAVCFVDDDAICENYSVIEEIFLLAEKLLLMPPADSSVD